MTPRIPSKTPSPTLLRIMKGLVAGPKEYMEKSPHHQSLIFHGWACRLDRYPKADWIVLNEAGKKHAIKG